MSFEYLYEEPSTGDDTELRVGGMTRLVSWVRIAPSFTIGSSVLMVAAGFPGAWLLADLFSGSSMFAGGLQIFGILGFGGWFSLIGSVERIEGAWQSLDAAARGRARGLIRAAGLWVWGYSFVWVAWMSLLATDRLPYRNSAFWIAASVLWCAGLWAALRISRETTKSISAVVDHQTTAPAAR